MVDRRGTCQAVHRAALRNQRRLLRGQVDRRYLRTAPNPRRHRQVTAALRTQKSQIGPPGERSDPAVNAIPDKFAQWDAAYVLRRSVSCRAPGVRGASGQLSHLPVGRLGLPTPGLLAQVSPADAAMRTNSWSAG